MTIIANRLQALRALMVRHGVDFYLVPSIDAHNSEYVPECWQRRTWISGFDGSAGEALIGLNDAYLSTDGRYFLQAESQLDSEYFTLLRQSGFVPDTENWLRLNAKGKKLAIDTRLVNIARFQQLNALMAAAGGELIVIDESLIDLARVTCNDVIAEPEEPAFILDEQYTGMSTVEKLSWLRSELTDRQVDYIALNVLDEIAWLFNLRGNDVEYNPFAISYAIIGVDGSSKLFINAKKISNDVAAKFAAANVSILPYSDFAQELSALSSNVLLDGGAASQWMQQQLSNATIKLDRSPIVLKKAIKNTVEIDGMRFSHRKDAVAMVKFLAWLEENWSGEDEISVANKLAAFRAEQDNFYGLSFATISGYAGNGAIIHYRSTPATCKKLGNESLFLLDSGAQYLEGTTDITRTLHLGTPTIEEQRHYTLVLKGHLALSRAVFPVGTRGEHLDILARAPLYSQYLNYRHGTGHGVGCFLGVHEGPQRISPAASNVALEHGMVVSNEPGVYFTDKYGIRIENLCLVRKICNQSADCSEYGPFYAFEDLTLVPYCKRLINVDLLSTEDKQQIKSYYSKIRELILPKLSGIEQEWLESELAIDGI